MSLYIIIRTLKPVQSNGLWAEKHVSKNKIGHTLNQWVFETLNKIDFPVLDIKPKIVISLSIYKFVFSGSLDNHASRWNCPQQITDIHIG